MATAIATEAPGIRTVNPSTGEQLAFYPYIDAPQVAAVVSKAQAAARAWGDEPLEGRAAAFNRLAQLFRERAPMLSESMADAMGKPIHDGKAEIEKCAGACEYFARHAAQYLGAEAVDMGEEGQAAVVFQPLGVVLALMPWNFPFWQVIRFAAPALMAGNGCVLRHADATTGCALDLETLFSEAGFPTDLFRTVIVPLDDVATLIDHPQIAAVTLTGSVKAGKIVAAKAGAALKKCVLELGGSDAYVVLEDADLEQAAELSASGRLVNNGQSCVAAKRFILPRSILGPFEQVLTRTMTEWRKRMGNPRDLSTRLGPLARFDLRDTLHRQVQHSVERGARLLVGGAPESGPGAFYPPTVLTDVRPGMPAFDEEVFGPVAAIVPAADETDAIRLANQSEFGLGSGVFTRDRARGRRIAEQTLEAGMSFVNSTVRSDARLPFGGIKHSGFGRELSSFGIREFVNIKTVFVGRGEPA